MTRTVVFVVGMGRSGSSALTRVLSLCGLGLPRTLIEPNAFNERGYFEPQEALQINDAYLSRFGSSWFDPTFRVEDEATAADQDALTGEAAAFLTAEFAVQDSVVIKDPRISGMLQPWLRAAAEAEAQVLIAHVFRPPAAVAGSLEHRDGVGRALSDALWLKYNLLAERRTRHLRRAFVGYEQLLADWPAAVARCAAAWDRPLSPDAAAIDAFLSPSLDHQGRASAEVLGAGPVDRWIAAAHRWLQAAARGSEPAFDPLDETFADFIAVDRFYRRANAGDPQRRPGRPET